MVQATQRWFSFDAVWKVAFCALVLPAVGMANGVVWEANRSKIDTTNYASLPATYYWFANFQTGALTPVTGAGMDSNEARNLPSWIHLETRPACKGFADDCTTADATIVSGYSFTETGLGGGSSSTGGQAGFNDLTLPDSTFGRSGQAVDTGSGVGTTTSMAALRILAGAPESFRMWVVVDNGVDPNFNSQARLRVNLRDTTGPPGFGDASAAVEAEALPGGFRLITAGSDPRANNGVADAWSFKLSGVNLHDRINIRPSSAGGDFGAFAGIMIQVVPEPSSVMLLMLGAVGTLISMRRRCA
jgi:hypothetical protein